MARFTAFAEEAKQAPRSRQLSSIVLRYKINIDKAYRYILGHVPYILSIKDQPFATDIRLGNHV
jgi:hypothetical protein